MAKIKLRHIWINLVSTGAEIHAKSSDRSYATSQDGEVITFAGGRQRAIGTEGIRGEFPFTLRDVTTTQIMTLRLWAGQTVQLRDHRGKKMFGVFFNVEEEERKDISLYDVNITFKEVSYQEGA